MTEKMDQSAQHINNKNDNRKVRNSPDFPNHNILPGIITRERSFVRTSNQQNINKRRSLAFNIQSGGSQQSPMRGKPSMDIYRPPNVRSDGSALNKLNVHAQEFTMMSNPCSTTTPPGDTPSSRSSMVFPAPSSPSGLLSPSKLSLNLHQQMQYAAVTNAMLNRQKSGGIAMENMHLGKGHNAGHRPILVSHSVPMNHITGVVSQQVPLINSPSSGNILHQTANTSRVKFAVKPQSQKMHNKLQQNNLVQLNNTMNQKYLNKQQQQQQQQYINSNMYITNGDNSAEFHNAVNIMPLQRSKSLSSADALTRGIAGLGLALGSDITDIGQFPVEIQTLIDAALDDPNKLNSRCLMELTSHFIKRTVESRRYALPISRMCLNIIAKEGKETFLEALLNTCRQWYQEREKLLYTIQGMKSPSRVRFTAFMAFLTEMFCQLKRRQLQLRTQCEGAPPPLVLLTLLSKCCEDCVKTPVKSLSEIECLFYVLTCIGQDMESQLPQQLENLLALVRDAFLNANDSAPAIRRTLLQLIELRASHWQLPGNTVLYYYPSTK